LGSKNNAGGYPRQWASPAAGVVIFRSWVPLYSDAMGQSRQQLFPPRHCATGRCCSVTAWSVTGQAPARMWNILCYLFAYLEQVKVKWSYPRNRPWRPIGVFPVRYEHHLHIKQYSYPRNRPWRPIGVFPVMYEHHLHIKQYSYPRSRPWRPIGMFFVRYEHLHINEYSYPFSRPWRPIGVFPVRPVPINDI
jgi:hypothetical protein